MPIFTFECQDCKVRQDKLLKFDDSNHPSECPKCGGKTVKVFDQSGTGFVLKGTGWYKNQAEGPE